MHTDERVLIPRHEMAMRTEDFKVNENTTVQQALARMEQRESRVPERKHTHGGRRANQKTHHDR